MTSIAEVESIRLQINRSKWSIVVFRSLLLTLVVSVVATPAMSQSNSEATVADATNQLKNQESSSTVRQLASLIEKEYFDPEVAARIAQALRDRVANDDYFRQQSLASLANELTKDMYAVCNDSHLSVAVSRTSDAESKVSPKPTREERGRRENFGVRRIEILNGNVGYLDLRFFYRPDEARESISAAMQVLQYAHAIIVDMRSNGGGSPETVSMLLSYFFQTETPLFGIVDRHGEVKKYSTLAKHLAGQSDSRPVYVLTSGRTFSGGEGFAFILQEHKRAEVIGEKTAGAANLARPFRVNERFEATIPIGRIASAVHGKNWEGSGVSPDVATVATDALDVAHERALRSLGRLRE